MYNTSIADKDKDLTMAPPAGRVSFFLPPSLPDSFILPARIFPWFLLLFQPVLLYSRVLSINFCRRCFRIAGSPERMSFRSRPRIYRILESDAVFTLFNTFRKCLDAVSTIRKKSEKIVLAIHSSDNASEDQRFSDDTSQLLYNVAIEFL